MPARVLETTLLWYDDVTTVCGTLRFVPPPDQDEWRDYTRSLVIDASSSPDIEWAHKLLVEGEAHRRLIASDSLLRFTTVRGLEQMVRLRAEQAFRLADNWTVEVENDEGARQ